MADETKKMIQVMLAPRSTPLMVASAKGHAPVVKALLAKPGSFIDQRNGAGETALMLASRYGHMEVVELLLEAGANMEGAMDEAIAAAKSNGRTEEEIGEAIAAGAAVPGVPAAAVAAAVGSMEKAFE